MPQLKIWEHRKDSKEFPRLKVIERPAWPRVGPSLGLLPLARPLNAGRASTGGSFIVVENGLGMCLDSLYRV